MLGWMRRLLTDHRVVMAAIFPYYFNWFVLLANKNIVFMGEKEEAIPYCLNHNTKHYEGVFGLAEIYEEMARLDDRMREEYTSPNA